VAASQAGQEAVYLRALLRGFNFRQVGASEIWEDNASCIMMSENPANRERTRHVDTRVHYRQVGATEIWEDNASCIMMSENSANRERTRHVDTRVHYLRELVRDGHLKVLKCAGSQNVADVLTKSLPRPALAKHRQYMWGTRIPFSAFSLSLKTGRSPTASYNIITMRISSRTRRPRNVSSVGARMCVCVCVCVCVDMTYDATIDTRGERNRV
jgi:hypothetical protein